jgi:hypothetical protein
VAVAEVALWLLLQGHSLALEPSEPMVVLVALVLLQTSQVVVAVAEVGVSSPCPMAHFL